MIDPKMAALKKLLNSNDAFGVIKNLIDTQKITQHQAKILLFNKQTDDKNLLNIMSDEMYRLRYITKNDEIFQIHLPGNHVYITTISIRCLLNMVELRGICIETALKYQNLIKHGKFFPVIVTIPESDYEINDNKFQIIKYENAEIKSDIEYLYACSVSNLNFQQQCYIFEKLQ